MRLLNAISHLFVFAVLPVLFTSCANTEIVESPKTAYVAQNADPIEPKIVWTSRTLTQKFDYLGQVKVRSWTYAGALERLVEAGKQLKADAVIDVHYESVGFLTSMQAFAIKYK